MRLSTIATPNAPAYVPSKFAVVGMTKQMGKTPSPSPYTASSD